MRGNVEVKNVVACVVSECSQINEVMGCFSLHIKSVIEHTEKFEIDSARPFYEKFSCLIESQGVYNPCAKLSAHAHYQLTALLLTANCLQRFAAM